MQCLDVTPLKHISEALLGHRHRPARAALRLRVAAGALAAGRAEVVDAEPGLPEPGAFGAFPSFLCPQHRGVGAAQLRAQLVAAALGTGGAAALGAGAAAVRATEAPAALAPQQRVATALQCPGGTPDQCHERRLCLLAWQAIPGETDW